MLEGLALAAVNLGLGYLIYEVQCLNKIVSSLKVDVAILKERNKATRATDS